MDILVDVETQNKIKQLKRATDKQDADAKGYIGDFVATMNN
jgi:hypothetical protein